MHLKTLSFITLLVTIPAISGDSDSRFEDADTNGDGIIQIPEVQKMIDGYLIGQHDKDEMYLHDLIDHFFEQPEYR